jgi:hypothetical protein
MPLNSRGLASKVQVQTKKTSISFMLCGLLGLGSLLLAWQVHAADLNLYAQNYKEQNSSHLKSLSGNPDTQMYVSNHKEDDNISMLESGYDLMGFSSFNGIDAPVDSALQHGKEIKADMVLVYRKYGSAKTASSKLQLIKEAAKKTGEIDPNDLVDEPTEYQYYASYWAKLSMPLLGVHVIKLVHATSDEGEARVEDKGLKIIAVIKDSPAYKATILKDDTLLKIGDVELNKSDDLYAAVGHYAGKAVDVVLKRGEDEIKMTVALNSHK